MLTFHATPSLCLKGLERIIYEKQCMGLELITEETFAFNQTHGRGVEVWVPAADTTQKTPQEEKVLQRLCAAFQEVQQVSRSPHMKRA